MILDHSVTVDGIEVWNEGRLQWRNFSATRECIDNSAELKSLFDDPSDKIGIAV